MRRREEIEVIARGLILAEGKILLCKAPKGYFYLPGGHVEHSEPATRALERELQEEAGVAVRAGLMACVAEVVFERKGRLIHEIDLVFHVEHALSSARPVESREPEISFHWTDMGDVLRLDLRPACIQQWLRTSPTRDWAFLSDVRPAQDGT